MLKFIKNIFRQEEREPAEIRFDELPSWLDNRKGKAESLLSKGTEKERAGIRLAATELSDVIQVLMAARFDDDIHPKLKSIAEKSLPQYFRAIHAALEKPLPEEPEAFYSAAAELLKSCINSARGQGKYLKTVFPEEMKAIEACVAIIGRGINAMNDPLDSYRKEMARIREAIKLQKALADMYEDAERAREKEERIGRHIGETNEKLASIERVAAELEQQRAEKGLKDREYEIADLKKIRDQTVHRYAALSMTASHVLRKAEKVAKRQHKSSDERVIEKAIGILSDHAVPDCADLTAALDAAYRPARRMIDAGEVVLKNKEERALFNSQEEFSLGIRNLCTCYTEQSERCDEADRAFTSHPVILRHEELMKEMNLLFESLAKEKKIHADLTQWHADLIRKIPLIEEQLKKTLEGIVGGDVQVSYPDTPSLSP